MGEEVVGGEGDGVASRTLRSVGSWAKMVMHDLKSFSMTSLGSTLSAGRRREEEFWGCAEKK